MGMSINLDYLQEPQILLIQVREPPLDVTQWLHSESLQAALISTSLMEYMTMVGTV